MKRNVYILLWMMGCSVFAYGGNGNEQDTAAVNKLLRQSSLLQRSNVDSCYLLAVQALQLSTNSRYQQGIAGAYIRMSAVMMIKGNNDSAMRYAQMAVSICQDTRDYLRMSYAYLLMGYLYQNQGKSDSSIAMIHRSQGFGELAGDSANLLRVYGAMGSFYTEYKEYDKALLYNLKAYKLSVKLNSLSLATDALMGIGNVYYFKGKLRTALYYYFKVDSLCRLINEQTGVAQNLNNIALCYADLKQYDLALDYYLQALRAYQAFGMRSEEANLYYNLACMYDALKQRNGVIFYANKALQLAQNLANRENVADCYQLLAKAYGQMGDFSRAYHYQEQYALLNDSLLNTEKIRSISEMQTKYETELKNREIDVLQRENDIAKLKASRSLGINFGLGGALLGIVCVAFAFYTQSKKKEKLNAELLFEKQKSDDLLLNILPEEVATELKQNGEAIARQYNNVTVLFTDFVNFTGLSEQMSPTELVREIHQNFTAFDAIIEKHGLEKIKTIGDAYLAVCGLPNETADHAQRVAKAALDIREYMAKHAGTFEVRIGIHSGPVVAGIVGVKKYAYDIWGDTVNTASRMESSSQAGKINISSTMYELVKREFVCTYRGKIDAKHKGAVDMYFLEESIS